MATQSEKFVEKALSYVGYGCNHFINTMADYGASYGQAWCAWFVSTIARECKLTDIIPLSGGAGSIPRAGVPAGMGKWYEGHNTKPKKGDIIVFTWNGLGSYESSGQDKYYSDHIGIVYEVDNQYVYTVEGNANGSNTSSTVCKKYYSLYSGKINGYYRPNYSDDTDENNEMNFKKGDKSDGVLAYKSLLMQANALNIIKASVDNSNSFGTGTYNATIEIQKKYGLEVDGIAGVNTITALRNAINKKLKEIKKPEEIGDGDWGIGVRFLKIALRTLQNKGLITTKPDDKFGYGSGTKKALMEIQKLSNIDVDGIAGKDTANAIEKQLLEM